MSGESMTVKAFGHSFTAQYEWVGADDSVGRIAHADVGAVYIDGGEDDISDIIAPHVRDAISASVTEHCLLMQHSENREGRCDD